MIIVTVLFVVVVLLMIMLFMVMFEMMISISGVILLPWLEEAHLVR